MKKIAFAAAFCSLGLLSCAHVDTMRETELDKIGAEDSGVMLPVHLASEDSLMVSAGCKLDLRKDGGMVDYPLDVELGSHVIFAKLPVGDYRIRDIECLETTWDLTEKAWPGFSSIAGKISILPPLDFKYVTHLAMVTGMKNRKTAQDEILGVMGRLPEAARARVVSAYGGSALTMEMVQDHTHTNRYQVADLQSGKTLAVESQKKAGTPSFTSCYRGEKFVNELWLGDVQIEAQFTAGHFEKLDVKPTQHSFSPQFLECAKSQIKEYKPGLEANLKYDFFL